MIYNPNPKLDEYANCSECSRLLRRRAMFKGKCLSCNAKKLPAAKKFPAKGTHAEKRVGLSEDD